MNTEKKEKNREFEEFMKTLFHYIKNGSKRERERIHNNILSNGGNMQECL